MLVITTLISLTLLASVHGYTDNSGNLTEIPLNVSSDTSLLDLASNHLSSITVLGDYASSLMYLILANNHISEITPGVTVTVATEVHFTPPITSFRKFTMSCLRVAFAYWTPQIIVHAFD